ncbi:dioxygenase [Novosphingobium endophyticum]|uniref:Dioxygenase n=1 Tax=Novosphingobium endophyticum TaxID=1955250 RepID=A0A916TV45_9SPHN|nr:class III extradiol ring-cleavage dioxygenase [Novosphingobium endophyticum]GGC11661.1 dioxygenase [Novosphingobium endophyticum]
MLQPAFYIPHGGGPCFFMEDPNGIWAGMAAFLRNLQSRLPERPSAILIVSGHWETPGCFTFGGSPRPELVYDYYGFPNHTYRLGYDVRGDPELAKRAARLLHKAGLPAEVDPERGLDHGAFVPLKVAFPDADVPVVEMALEQSLDPELHLAAGRALAPLREEGVLILASGMSFHNLRGFSDARFAAPSRNFDRWLAESVALEPALRSQRLRMWSAAPSARLSHPREEHLLPIHVAAGAAEGIGECVYHEKIMKTVISGFMFS